MKEGGKQHEIVLLFCNDSDSCKSIVNAHLDASVWIMAVGLSGEAIQGIRSTIRLL